MCTVTFLTQNNQVFITSNRDESPDRRAKGLLSKSGHEASAIHFPLDETSGGSWISLTDSGRAVCLLNGAYEAFVPDPPYRQSRGTVVIDAAQTPDAHTYMEDVDLRDIAPFTLLIYEKNQLKELVWDGTEKHLRSLPADQPYIWSSATLYPADVRAWRKSLFDQWLSETQSFNRNAIIDFHQKANSDPDNGFVMNRNEVVKTLSITSIVLAPSTGSILHLELDRNSAEEIEIAYDR